MLLLWFDSFYWSVIGDFHDSDITAARVILSLVDFSIYTFYHLIVPFKRTLNFTFKFTFKLTINFTFKFTVKITLNSCNTVCI